MSNARKEVRIKLIQRLKSDYDNCLKFVHEYYRDDIEKTIEVSKNLFKDLQDAEKTNFLVSEGLHKSIISHFTDIEHVPHKECYVAIERGILTPREGLYVEKYENGEHITKRLEDLSLDLLKGFTMQTGNKYFKYFTQYAKELYIKRIKELTFYTKDTGEVHLLESIIKRLKSEIPSLKTVEEGNIVVSQIGTLRAYINLEIEREECKQQ